MRGENKASDISFATLIETPPRAWGKPIAHVPVSIAVGNTPTCVGKTVVGSAVGQHKPETPPRAWGKRIAFAAGVAVARNTPTCVGKT